MVKKINQMFALPEGAKIYDNAIAAICEHNMDAHIKGGVLVGLSGGADSVMLLSFLVCYRLKNGDFPILAVHINHGIRGDEADRDEIFSKALANSLGVDFISLKLDIPQMAKEEHAGLEEVARNARYREFSKIIQSRNDISTIAVAHNSTDNLETVIFNLMRGAGSSGMSGIRPVRENIIRPLIYSSKSDIVKALDLSGVQYVTDSTNLSNEYTRNYIRNDIIPKLSRLALNPENMAMRMSKNLICDEDYILSAARDFIATKKLVRGSELSCLHFAVFARVVKLMCEKVSCFGIENSHLDKLRELLSKENFSYSLPGGFTFICEYGICSVIKSREAFDFSVKLDKGINQIPRLGAAVLLSDREKIETSLNVYKNSIQVKISSAIIDGDIYIRNRKDGDSYKFKGITRKLKKLFNDKKIPPSVRDFVPVVCDNSGILWVPGFGIRDGERGGENTYISIFTNEDSVIQLPKI